MALALIGCISFALAGSAGTSLDPLISKSYADGTYRSSVIAQGKSNIDSALGGVYDTAVSRLEDITGGSAPSGYSHAENYQLLNLKSGGSVSVVTGGSVVITKGVASVSVAKGTVINVSTGKEVQSGASLNQYQRYFAAEDTEAVFTVSGSGALMAEGWYKASGVTDDPGYTDVFSDVSQADWYYDAVYYCYENGLFSGTTSTTFSPNAPMTRAMFVTVLYRMAGSPYVYGTAAFTDLDSAMYYMDAVKWASANGIVSGYGEGLFGPDDPITREQMAVIMYNYARWSGRSVSVSAGVMNAFPDSGSVSDWAKTQMSWAVSNKLINGSDGYLLPSKTAPRCQVAQIVKNYKETM